MTELEQHTQSLVAADAASNAASDAAGFLGDTPPEFTPIPAEKPKKSLAWRVFKFVIIFIVIMFLLIDVVAIVLYASNPARNAVRSWIDGAFGLQQGASFDQFFDQTFAKLFAQITSAASDFAGNAGAWWFDFCAQLAARWNSVPFEQFGNEALSAVFGPGAPTVGELASGAPTPPSTGDPVSDVMLVVLAVCIPIIVVLALLIRRRDANVEPTVAAKRYRRRVRLLSAVSLIATVVAALNSFLTLNPALIILTIILLGFTVRTFQTET